MSEVQKQKQHPIPPRLEAQLKSKGASLPTQDDYGGAGNAVKGQDERPKTAPLTAFPAPMLSCALFTLDSGRCRHTRNDKGGEYFELAIVNFKFEIRNRLCENSLHLDDGLHWLDRTISARSCHPADP